MGGGNKPVAELQTNPGIKASLVKTKPIRNPYRVTTADSLIIHNRLDYSVTVNMFVIFLCDAQ